MRRLNHGGGLPWIITDSDMPLKYLEAVAKQTAREVYLYGELMNLGKNLAIAGALCEAYTVGWDQCMDLHLNKAKLLSDKEYKFRRWHPGINLPEVPRARRKRTIRKSRSNDSGTRAPSKRRRMPSRPRP